MLGTIVNTACIIVGTLVGTLFKKGLGEKYTKTLFNAMGLASLALGANSFVANMPKSEFPVLFCWQGAIYLAATLASSSPIFQGTLVNELAIVGGVLIISSGLSILDIKDCKTLNYIPALLIPIVWFLIKELF